MKNQSYSAAIEVAKTAEDVFNHINDVSKWWSKDYEGSSTTLNDEFIIDHPDRHYSNRNWLKSFLIKKLYGS